MAASKRGGILRRPSAVPSHPSIALAKASPSGTLCRPVIDDILDSAFPLRPVKTVVIKTSSQNDELYAASTGQTRWLQMTLQKTECPTQADINGFSALHSAALFGRLDCLKVLVEKYNVDVDSPSLTGWRPVHLVMNKESEGRALECLEYLISWNADVNVQSQNGVSPLHKAASEGRTDCVKVLIEAGADVHAKDNEGQEPIDLCRMWGHRECSKYLASAMWKIDKRNLAQEMSRLNETKRECQEEEEEFLRKRQMELNRFNKLVFSEWLAKKHLSPPSARILGFLEKRAQSIILQKKRERWGGLGTLTSSLWEASWPDTFQRYGQQPWNPSSNPANPPVTCIFRPNMVRLGVSPDPSVDHDFSSFLFLAKNRDGEHEIRVGKVGKAFTVPVLSRETIQRSLYPHAWPSRLRVPQGFKPQHIWDVKRKRPPSPQHRWTDQMALSLRQTLDPTFVTALKAHLATYSDAEALFAKLDSDCEGNREPSGQSLSSSRSRHH
ncbi:ankyrin repeat domain-containing protein 53 [Heteronotia binoei]|uniref:ankyrin repeat domain-containing protein 53 n=1 Tax=Heteronotia binoei TaxID=13085 RepID=UPI0029314B4F|nr:ankyrin repeat domain-containing protein 53 [Heteronotia binoei]